MRIPFPETLGLGSFEPIITWDIPELIIKSVHGGVRPKIQQGSNVTINVESLTEVREDFMALTSACANPA